MSPLRDLVGAARGRLVTGERVTRPTGNYNPNWQRHVAAYRLMAPYLPDGRVLDLGCGVGHSFRELAPRETVGVDLDPDVLVGQERETHAADMRSLPFGAETFASVISVHSIEHVRDPVPVFEEITRVLEPGGTCVLVTPNRLTFARPDEIIDPYHFREYDAQELAAACRRYFEKIEVIGLFASSRFMQLKEEQSARLDRILARDRLRVRRVVPIKAKQLLYDYMHTRGRSKPVDPRATAITPDDFHLGDDDLDLALDVIAVARRPRTARRHTVPSRGNRTVAS